VRIHPIEKPLKLRPALYFRYAADGSRVPLQPHITVIEIPVAMIDGRIGHGRAPRVGHPNSTASLAPELDGVGGRILPLHVGTQSRSQLFEFNHRSPRNLS